MVAGGTGGHIFPALALGEELRNHGLEVVWVGRAGSMEERVALKAGFQFERVTAEQIAGKGFFSKLRALGAMALGLIQSIKVIDKIGPEAVVAAGGFVSAPVLLAAWLKRVKFFLLEQNSVPGKVTKFFARFAEQIFLTFPIEGNLAGKWTVTGAPLRQGIIKCCLQGNSIDSEVKGSELAGKKTLLVLGGSQGARVLNLAALDLAATLSNLHVIIVTGRRDYESIRSLVHSKNCEVVEWTDHPEELYRRATLAVTRAGAMALSELLCFGIPMIIVPFPYAADRHQDANARYVAKIGAGVVLKQTQLSGLTSLVHSLIADTERFEAMRKKAREAARIDAGIVIARWIVAAISAGEEQTACLAN